VEEEVREVEIGPAVDVLTGSGSSPARFEALRKVAAARTLRSTGALIAVLRDENLRLARLAWKALRTSTGQDIGFDPEAWERWWSSRAAGAGGAEGATAGIEGPTGGARETADA
jgi:hypothetical protein